VRAPRGWEVNPRNCAAGNVPKNEKLERKKNGKTLSECHRGKKQEYKGARPPCAHGQHIKKTIDNAKQVVWSAKL
jgi:hypothetical protein